MENDIKDNLETSPPEEVSKEDKPEEPSKLKLFFLCACAGLVAAVLALLVVGSNFAPNFMVTDSYCDALIDNATNQSFQYGIGYGLEYAIASITEEVVQCNQIPMNYSNYTYTLIAAECLNLNNTGGK